MNKAIKVLEEFYKKKRDEIPINCDEYFDGILSGIENAIQILKEYNQKQIDTVQKP